MDRSSEPWTYRELRDAVSRIRNGERTRDIHQDYGRSAANLSRAIRKHLGVSVQVMEVEALNRKRHHVMIRYASQEISAPEAARLLGVSESAVYVYAKKHGYAPNRKTNQASACDDRRVFILRNNGMTWPEIAKIVHRNRNTCARMYRRYEVIFNERVRGNAA